MSGPDVNVFGLENHQKGEAKVPDNQEHSCSPEPAHIIQTSQS